MSMSDKAIEADNRRHVVAGLREYSKDISGCELAAISIAIEVLENVDIAGNIPPHCSSYITEKYRSIMRSVQPY